MNKLSRLETPSVVALLLALSACSSAQPEHVPGPADPPPDPTATPAETDPRPRVEATLESQGLSGAALDKSVDPCVDFYQFACGGWEKTTPIPDDRSRWSRSFSEIDQRNESDLRTILEEATKKKAEDSAVGKVGRFYAACMDESAIEKAGAKPLKPLLDEVKRLTSKKDLTKLLVSFHQHGIWALFDVSSGQDYKDATKMIGMIDQNGLGLPDRDYYLKTDADKVKIKEFYVAHVEKMFKLAGFSDKESKEATTDVLRIETALATASKSREERRDPVGMYNKVDRPGLVKSTPVIDWDGYFKGLGFANIVDISVSAPNFMKALDDLANKETPKALQHYFAWQVIHNAAPRLSKAFVDEDFSLTKTLTGQKVQRERWKRCIDAVDENLGELLAQPFVDLRFGGESKTAAESYVHAIAGAMDGRLDELDWMDAPTREKAKQKLHAMAYLIGYPAKWKTYDFTVKDAFFDDILAGAAFKLKDSLQKVGKPVDRGEWYMTPPTVNAYYDPQKNQMVFPAGILQPPFYSAKASVPVNLGAMGMVVGHELTHGFDDEGSQFDKDGNLANWWSDSTGTTFKGKGQCVEKQYGNYEVLPGLKLNGKLTLGENIADVGGMKLAFRAYRNMRKDAKEQVIADGFTEDQQFFLATGQIWCSKYREETTRLMAQVDPHSYPKYRVNGPMSQIPEFQKA
ncbi:MAG TPA: M13 family metallopeptidase, partial [Polyangiaceae bacterium]|nr:M13 family metallopeptidase [Polyangiaceae bacterium]